jgi:DNA invertase Pin-like site-specific DNA recombinase
MKKHGRLASHIANRFWSKVDKNGPVPAHDSKGRQSRGERHATAKLTNAQAMDVIRKKAGGATTRELAREFGVSKTAIAAVGRANWLHLATPGQRQRMDRYVRRRGADHGNAKITEEQAKEIIRRKANGEPKARLARLFGISAQQVSRVGTVSWTHLVTATR